MASDFARFKSSAELRKSAAWAAAIAVLLCAFGASASMAIAHSGGPFLVLFAPVLPVLLLFGDGGRFQHAPEWLFITVAVLAQFFGTFVVVHILRAGFSSVPRDDA